MRYSTSMRTPYQLEIGWWVATKSLERRGRAPPSEVAQGNYIRRRFTRLLNNSSKNPSFHCCVAPFGNCGMQFMNITLWCSQGPLPDHWAHFRFELLRTATFHCQSSMKIKKLHALTGPRRVYIYKGQFYAPEIPSQAQEGPI